MKTFSEYITEKKYNMSDIETFVKDSGITNMDFELDGKIVKFSGYISKSGNAFDNFYDIMKKEYGKSFNFIEWNKDNAKFEVKLK